MDKFWRRERPQWLLLLLGLVLLISSAQADVRVQDDRHLPVVIARPAQRIVSLLPSLTETVCVLGACSRLVGVDRYSNWPASVQSLPSMGGGIDPNIEAIVAARPDLVLLASSARGAERLESLGIPVLRLEPRTLSDARRVLVTVAQALGIAPAEYTRKWQNIESGWMTAALSVPASMKGQRVYFEVSPVPYGAGPQSFIGETLHHLGLMNIMSSDMGPFPKINPEFVVRAQPDIIMLSDSSRASLMQRPGWAKLSAVQRDRVCAFDQTASDVLVRAGPRLAEAAQRVVGCLQRLAREAR